MWVTEGRLDLDNALSSRPLEMDPQGFVLVGVDREAQQLVVKYYVACVNSAGAVCDPSTKKPIPANGAIPYEESGEIRGRSAKEICISLFEAPTEPVGVSLQSHAAYIGRELVFAEMALRYGCHYVQDQDQGAEVSSATVEMLRSHAGSYQGSGTNHEGEDFTASLSIKEVGQGNGVLIAFCAQDAAGMVFHDEAAIVAADPTGHIVYLPVSSNIPFVLEHRLASSDEDTSLRFITGDLDSNEGFREEIRVELDDSSVRYTYSWGMPGEEFGERSSVTLSPADAS